MALHLSWGGQGAVSADWGPFLQSPETSWAPFGSIIVALFAVKKTATDEMLYNKKPHSFPFKCDTADALSY